MDQHISPIIQGLLHRSSEMSEASETQFGARCRRVRPPFRGRRRRTPRSMVIEENHPVLDLDDPHFGELRLFVAPLAAPVLHLEPKTFLLHGFPPEIFRGAVAEVSKIARQRCKSAESFSTLNSRRGALTKTRSGPNSVSLATCSKPSAACRWYTLLNRNHAAAPSASFLQHVAPSIAPGRSTSPFGRSCAAGDHPMWATIVTVQSSASESDRSHGSPDQRYRDRCRDRRSRSTYAPRCRATPRHRGDA